MAQSDMDKFLKLEKKLADLIDLKNVGGKSSRSIINEKDAIRGKMKTRHSPLHYRQPVGRACRGQRRFARTAPRFCRRCRRGQAGPRQCAGGDRRDRTRC